jgi:hypothetical protein
MAETVGTVLRPRRRRELRHSPRYKLLLGRWLRAGRALVRQSNRDQLAIDLEPTMNASGRLWGPAHHCRCSTDTASRRHRIGSVLALPRPAGRHPRPHITASVTVTVTREVRLASLSRKPVPYGLEGGAGLVQGCRPPGLVVATVRAGEKAAWGRSIRPAPWGHAGLLRARQRITFCCAY